MKKLRFMLLPAIALFIGTAAFAQSTAPTGFQFGPFLNYNQGMGDVIEHEVGNAGGGINVYYQLPLNLPEFVPFSNIGISATADFNKSVGLQSYIEYWNVSDILAGVWFDWNLFSVFKIRPEASYGMSINFVNSNQRRVSGVFSDQIARFGCSLLWEPVFLRGFSVYGGASYVIMPEQDTAGNFLGFKAGILYRPENTWRKMQKAKKEAEEQALIAAEAQKRIDEEKKRHDDLEKQRLETERKLQEAEEKAKRDALLKEQQDAEAKAEAQRKYEEALAQAADEEEKARIEADRQEQERIEAEKKAEEERLAAEEAAKLEAERLALEEQIKQAEEAKKAAEEAAKLAAEEAAAKQAEADRIAAEEAARQEAEAKAKTVKNVEIQINEDGSVNIAIPTLSFKSNSSELSDSKSNAETLAKVVEILGSEDYAQFKCDITGYVNSDNEQWTSSEEKLALSRAQTVIDYLVSRGIDQAKLTPHYGSGKTTNKEYNRRVEFKLVK